MTRRRNSREPFFVGWAVMPGRLALFLWGLLPLVAGIVVGAALALAIDDVTPARTTVEGGVMLTGVVALDPYPMLRLPPDAEHPAPRTVLVVQGGKNGARPRLEAHDGSLVTVHGLLYRRDGALLFELAGGEDAVMPAEAPAFAPAAAQPLGRHALAGEIVDPKCYLGAMRPGEGKPHMMCGNRCLIGGIPPMLAVHGTDGRLAMVLLVDAAGGAVTAPFEPWTSLPVRVEGEMFALDDLLVMRVGAGRVMGL
jgi:hypothetical protein